MWSRWTRISRGWWPPSCMGTTLAHMMRADAASMEIPDADTPRPAIPAPSLEPAGPPARTTSHPVVPASRRWTRHASWPVSSPRKGNRFHGARSATAGSRARTGETLNAIARKVNIELAAAAA
jgi:hypothetical protein